MPGLSERTKVAIPLGAIAALALTFGIFCWSYFSSAQESNAAALDTAVKAMSSRMDSILTQAQEAGSQTQILVNELKHVNINLGKIDEKMNGHIKQLTDLALTVGQLQRDYTHLSERIVRLESKQ